MKVAEIMTKDPLTVRRETSLDQAMELMEEHDIRHLPVLDETGLAGMVSDRDVLEATGWLSPRQREVIESPAGNVGEFMRNPVASVGANDPVSYAMGLLVQGRISCACVVQGAEVTGLVTEVDILRAYASACRRGAIVASKVPRVREHMTLDPVTVTGDASADEAADLMREKAVRHLPVVDEGRVVGILTDRDVRRWRGRGQLELARVGELMSSLPQTAKPDERLSSVALILASQRISALPVIDEQRLMGIATTVDVMIPCALALQRL